MPRVAPCRGGRKHPGKGEFLANIAPRGLVVPSERLLTNLKQGAAAAGTIARQLLARLSEKSLGVLTTYNNFAQAERTQLFCQGIRPFTPLILVIAFVATGNLFVESISFSSTEVPFVANQKALREHIGSTLVSAGIMSAQAAALPDSESVQLASSAHPGLVTEASTVDQPDRSGRDGSIIIPSTYTVQAGDTLSTLAARYGLTVDTIRYTNKLSNADQLKLGQTLKFPVRNMTAKEIANAKNQQSKTKLASFSNIGKTKTQLVNGSERISGARSGWILPVRYTAIARGLQRGHRGIDYDAPKGTPVYSACSGTVIDVDPFGAWNSGFGNNVVVSCGGGVTMRYAHLSAYSSADDVGASVDEGQRLGSIGNTGNTWGAMGGYHLHFQVEKNGVAFDPGLR